MKFTKEEYIKGIDLCVKNSDELIQEAQILWLLKRPRAYALYQFSIEEIGKAVMIFTYLIKNKFEFSSEREFNFPFKDHKEKNELSNFMDIVMLSIMKTKKSNTESTQEYLLKIAKEDTNDWQNKLNLNKNQSLYVSVNDNLFQMPSDIITPEMIEDISSKAQIRSTTFKVLHKTGIDNVLNSQDPGLFYADEFKGFRDNLVLLLKDIYNKPNYVPPASTSL